MHTKGHWNLHRYGKEKHIISIADSKPGFLAFFFQTLLQLVMLLKGHYLSLCICLPKLSQVSLCQHPCTDMLSLFHTHTHTHAETHARIHASTHTHACTQTHTHTHSNTHMRAHTHTKSTNLIHRVFFYSKQYKNWKKLLRAGSFHDSCQASYHRGRNIRDRTGRHREGK